MLVKLYLHGHLRDRINKDFVEIEASTVMDALQGLAGTYKKELKAPLDIGRWKIKVKGYEIKDSWYVPLIENELHIYPVFRTAKKNGLVQVIVGAVLIAVGAVLYYTGVGAPVGTFMMKLGLGIMLSGGITMLCSAPRLDTSKPKDSKYLGAQGNTVEAGTRIPFGYGIFKVAGHYISYNVSTKVVRETV